MKKNEMPTIIRFILDAPSIGSAKFRYNVLKGMATSLNKGDTFIHEDLNDFVDYAYLGNMVRILNRDYKNLDFIQIERPAGTVLRDEKGRAFAKTSCNVYRMDYDTDVLKKQLESVREYIYEMFS